MSILIDGFNLIYKFPELENFMYEGKLDSAMKGLTKILKNYNNIVNKKITVVYDGKKEMGNDVKYEKSGSIEIYYSLDVTADDIIKSFIKKKTNPKMMTVVTSDKKLIFYLNRFQPTIIRSEDFSISVTDTIQMTSLDDSSENSPDEKLSDDEIESWEKLFEEGSDNKNK